MRLVSTTLTANSQDIIGDALRSVVDWVDACVVIDTGISDRTLEVARAIAGDKLLVREFPWIDDFSAARNFALEAANDVGADWAVTVDTDERLVLDGLDVRAMLSTQAAGILYVESDTREYSKERFFRLPTSTKWSGPTHEALLGAGEVGTATLQAVHFRELLKDDVAVSRKFERDIAILERHTRQHPGDPRWHYYLGDSYRHVHRYHDAIAAYEACAALHGWDEESAWACYQAAQCHLALGELERAIESCAAGLSRHAGIAELPWLAASASNQLGNHAQAVYWARLAIAWGSYGGAGSSVPRIGFRHLPGLYEGPYDVLRSALGALGNAQAASEAEHHFHLARAARLRLSAEPGGPSALEPDLSVAIHSYYVGRRDEGLQACERLLAQRLDPRDEALVRRNRTWYTPTLDQRVSARFVRLDLRPAHAGWSLFNPTILTHEGTWLALVRSSNYRIERGRYVIPEVYDDVIKTEYVLVELSASLAVVRARVCSGPGYPRSGYPVEGLEDCRLYLGTDGLRVSATIRDLAGFDGSCRIATARLDAGYAAFSELEVLGGPGAHEKNWMPILGQERWLYYCSHEGGTATVVRARGDDRVQWHVEPRSPSPHTASRFRGGSQLVPVDDGWLALVHEVSEDDGYRFYEHRFVRFDETFAIVAWSPPFCFRETRAIEFAAGLACHGNRLVASFGVRDAEAWLVELDLLEVLAFTSCR